MHACLTTRDPCTVVVCCCCMALLHCCMMHPACTCHRHRYGKGGSPSKSVILFFDFLCNVHVHGGSRELAGAWLSMFASQ